MKIYTLLAVVLLFSIVGCKKKDDNTIPESLEDKRALVIRKQSELAKLSAFIKELQDSIEVLDPTKKEAKLVTAIALKKEDFKHFIEVQSNVEATDMVFASSDMGGRILTIHTKEGQYVSRGKLIATVDAQPIAKQIEQTENALTLARDVFERQDRLWKQKIGTEMQYLQAKNRVEQLEKTIELLQIQLQKANVYAPISGVVENVILKAGELAGPGAPIVQILNPNKLVVAAQVPEIYTKSVRKGQRVQVVVPALDDMEFTAPITLIGSSINPANRTFNVEVATSARKGKLKPNLLAKLIIMDKAYKDVITIPVDIVRQDMSGQDYVMIFAQAEGQRVAQKRIVELGDSYKGKVIIKKGLTESDNVIVEGAGSLVDGEMIHVAQ